MLTFSKLPEIEVIQGQHKPLLRPPLHCPEIHGDSGLDGPLGGPVLPPATSQATHGGPPVIFNRIKTAFHQHNKQKIVLMATGALTNVALLIILYPEITEMIEIVIMGGALGLGNTGAVVEFNIQTDPEAAHVVFESGIKLTMVPLEVTHTALCTQEVAARIINADAKHPFLEIILELLMFFQQTYKRVFKFDHPPLHDPCAVAYVIAPEIFQVEHLRVDIEVKSSLTAGQTVVDVYRHSKNPPNAYVCVTMDIGRFWDLMIGAIHEAAKAVVE